MKSLSIQELKLVKNNIARYVGDLLDRDIGDSGTILLPEVPTNYALGCTIVNGKIAEYHVSIDRLREKLTDFNLNIDKKLHSLASKGGLSNAETRVQNETILKEVGSLFSEEPSAFLIKSAPWEGGTNYGITPIRVSEIIDIAQIVIIVGQLGSGKTTLLRQICKSILLSQNIDDLSILVSLREAGIQLINDISKNIDPIESIHSAAVLPKFIEKADLFQLTHNAIDSGKLTILLDGLDEITNDDIDAKNVIRSLQSRFKSRKNIRILISSRKPLELCGEFEGVVEVGIGSYIPQEIKKYMEITVDPQILKNNSSKIESIIKTIPDLVTRPLFIRALVDYLKKGKKPEEISKTKLMEEVVDTLLTRWTTRRSESKSFQEIVKCTENELTDILEQISLISFHDWCDGVINAGSIRVETVYSGLNSANKINPKIIENYLTSDIGVVCYNPNPPSSFYFPHRSVGEYLAAKALSQLNEDDLIVEVRKAVKSNLDVAEPVIDFLSEIFTHNKSHSKLLALLAFCIDDCNSVKGEAASCLALCSALMPIVKELQKGTLSNVHKSIFDEYRDTSVGALQEASCSINRRVSLSKQVSTLNDKRTGIDSDGKTLVFDFLNYEPVTRTFGANEQNLKSIKEQFQNEEMTALDRELPSASVKIGAYQISKYQVTVAQFHLFLIDPVGYMDVSNWESLSDNQKPSQSQKISWLDHLKNELASCPITQISWFEAVAFCKWASKKLGTTIRLPTELEWENASTTSDFDLFPWGNFFDSERCNWVGTGYGAVTPVGTFARFDDKFPADIIGNVWEWTSTIARDPNSQSTNVTQDGFYKYSVYPSQLDSNRMISGVRRVVRGGCYLNRPWMLRTTFRASEPPTVRYRRQGFRVAKGVLI